MQEAHRGGLHPRIYTLALNRSKYDVAELIEQAIPKTRQEDEVLVETLLELTLLAHSRLVAGGMLGNMPRVALQLRPRHPLRYRTTDAQAWCVHSHCCGEPLGAPGCIAHVEEEWYQMPVGRPAGRNRSWGRERHRCGLESAG